MRLEEDEPPAGLAIRINSFQEQEVMFYSNQLNHMPLIMPNGLQQMVAVPIINPTEYVFTYLRLVSKLFPEAYDNWRNALHQAPFDSVNAAHEYCISYKVSSRSGISNVFNTTTKRNRETDSNESDDESNASSRSNRSSRKRVQFQKRNSASSRKRSNSIDSLSSGSSKIQEKSKAPKIPSGPCRNCEKNGLKNQFHWINFCPLKVELQEKEKSEEDKDSKRKKV
jgi:hypothetical protein